MTQEERRLWYDFLKNRPFSVKRQKPVGPYIADFYVPQAKLVIELDGKQHRETEHQQQDAARDAYMEALGLTVLRYSNQDINLDFDGVCQDILKHIP
jgi:very-short-patch-repair endonuclease